eukprot:8324833-Ditylum_brightwellii.AAC.1
MAHKVIAEAYIRIPNGDGSYSDIHSCYTPTMPMIVILPGEMHRQDTSNFTAELVAVMLL